MIEWIKRKIQREGKRRKLPEEIEKARTALERVGAKGSAKNLVKIYDQLEAAEWHHGWKEMGLELVMKSIDRAPVEHLISALEHHDEIKRMEKPERMAGYLLLHMNFDPRIVEVIKREINTSENPQEIREKISQSYFAHQLVKQGSRWVGLRRIVEIITGRNSDRFEELWRELRALQERAGRETNRRVDSLVENVRERLREKIDVNNVESVGHAAEVEKYVEELEREWEQGKGSPPQEFFMWRRKKKM